MIELEQNFSRPEKALKKSFVVFVGLFLVITPLCFSSHEIIAAPIVGSSSVTLYAIADAYVNSSNPDSNYGLDDYLELGKSAQSSAVGYMMFDLSVLPQGADVTFATLQVALADIGGSEGGVEVYYCSRDDWTEREITWNNKPNYEEDETDYVYYSGPVSLGEYYGWNVTADVRNAIGKGKLTEVVVDSRGYSHYYSKESFIDLPPKLYIQYLAKPVSALHLGSAQDAGNADNIGFVSFENNTFSLPSDIDVVPDTYQVTYDGGYTFVRWETSGGVTVSDFAAKTTGVTITGDGSLVAIGNVISIEYAYDPKAHPRDTESQKAGCMDVVRFTPVTSDRLTMVRFYLSTVGFYSKPKAFRVHILDENRSDIVSPSEETPLEFGWFDVDVSSLGINVSKDKDFYVGIEWITDNNPYIGKVKDDDPNTRSWSWDGTLWERRYGSDFMIRAVVGTSPEPTSSESSSPSSPLSTTWILNSIAIIGLAVVVGLVVYFKKRRK